MADSHTTLEERAAKALKAFPLPAQSSTSHENYRRILDWLYGSYPDVATLIIDLEDHEWTTSPAVGSELI